MENTKKENLKKVMNHLPLGLTALFSAIFFGVGIVALIYSAVTYIAFGSPMVMLILFGLSILSFGIALAFVDGFLRYKKRLDQNKNEEPSTEAKTSIAKGKLKISFQTICFGVVILGAVFIIVSAGLGATSRDEWSKVKEGYLTGNGYYAETKSFEVSFDTSNPDRPIHQITLDMKDKNVVVIYTDDDFITIRGYETFPSQLSVNYGGKIVKIFENSSPSTKDVASKFLGFMFDENAVESQIRIYIPSSLKNQIQIDGDHVVAQN